jgi:hypothetical protein
MTRRSAAKEDSDMTASTQGLTAQGLAGSGIPSQQGPFSPGFPPPIGAEQYFGTPYPYGFQPYAWPQATYGMQPYSPPSPVQIPYGNPYGNQTPFGFQQPATGQVAPQQVQQLIQQLVGQVLPIAQQMILPQVIAQAVQLVQQQAQQLITQLAAPQLMGQQPFSAVAWQPFWTPQAPGLGARPYSLFS